MATLAYRPTWTARQSFVATASDAAGATLASATASFVATSASHPFAGTVQALRPDGSIGRAVTGVLLGVVALLWIALLAVVVRVNLGLRAGGALATEHVVGDCGQPPARPARGSVTASAQ